MSQANTNGCEYWRDREREEKKTRINKNRKISAIQFFFSFSQEKSVRRRRRKNGTWSLPFLSTNWWEHKPNKEWREQRKRHACFPKICIQCSRFPPSTKLPLKIRRGKEPGGFFSRNGKKHNFLYCSFFFLQRISVPISFTNFIHFLLLHFLSLFSVSRSFLYAY